MWAAANKPCYKVKDTKGVSMYSFLILTTSVLKLRCSFNLWTKMVFWLVFPFQTPSILKAISNTEYKQWYFAEWRDAVNNYISTTSIKWGCSKQTWTLYFSWLCYHMAPSSSIFTHIFYTFHFILLSQRVTQFSNYFVFSQFYESLLAMHSA